MTDSVTVRPGEYHDSVVLMQASRDVAAVDGVEAALVAMATELNLHLLAEMSFSTDDVARATPNDLIVAIRGRDEATVLRARGALDAALRPSPTDSSDGVGLSATPAPQTAEATVRHAGANIALISVPGDHAYVEAMGALNAGAHVMLFSDNVSLTQERALKETAASRDLLVMGPDCGTVVIGGVGLGFANAVRQGPVGIVGASGTGIQQICCLLDGAGVGVSHAIGTGSRDLSDEIGGTSTLRALEALDRDPATNVIVVVSKPPSDSVAATVRNAAAACTTPTILALLGESSAGDEAVTLEGATVAALALLGQDTVVPRSWPALPAKSTAQPRPGGTFRGTLRGLFSGGSLCREATTIVAQMLGPSEADGLIDLGDDQFTRGRAHPMIDYRLRLERMHAAIDDPAVSVVLLDVVLGYGAHPHPSDELAPLIETARRNGVAVVVSLCGTQTDPQGLERQAEALQAAGASVWLSNAAAARHAVMLVETALVKEGQ